MLTDVSVSSVSVWTAAVTAASKHQILSFHQQVLRTLITAKQKEEKKEPNQLPPTDSLALIQLMNGATDVNTLWVTVFHCRHDLLLKGEYSVCLPHPPTHPQTPAYPRRTVYQMLLEEKPSGKLQLHSLCFTANYRKLLTKPSEPTVYNEEANRQTESSDMKCK